MRCAVLVLMALPFSAPAHLAAQQPQPGDPPAWVKLMMPNENHKRLETLVGTWDLKLKSFGGEGGKASEAKGKAVFRSMMGGRFLMEEAKTELGGVNFDWMGWHGYDNARKKYVAAFIDNMGTSIDTMEGAVDESGKVITYTGEQADPRTGAKSGFRWIITLECKDRFTVEMIKLGAAGKETRSLEVTGARAKPK